MKTVRIEKDELYSIVDSNKDKHRKEFLEAVKDYKDLVLTIAAENFELAETQDLESFKKLKGFPSEPTSYEADYNRALRMLELSVDDVIELESDVFNQLVLDEWGWKHRFESLKSSYKLNG